MNVRIKSQIIIRCIVLLTALIGLNGPLPAQVMEEDAIILGYLREAAENNRGLKSAFNEFTASLESVPAAGALDDPQLSMGVFLRPMQFPMGNQRAEFSLMQMFPWFGMLRTQRNEANAMANARYETFRSLRNQLSMEIRNNWYALCRVDGVLALQDEELEILEIRERILLNLLSTSVGSSPASSQSMRSQQRQISGASSSGAAESGMSMGGGAELRPSSGTGRPSADMGSMPSGGGGSGALSALLNLEMEKETLLVSKQSLEEDRKALSVRFNQLRGVEPGARIETRKDLDLPEYEATLWIWDEVYTDQHPMQRMIEKEQEAALEKEKMARLNGRPMMGLGVNYMLFSPLTENGMNMGGDNMIMPMATLSLPIYRKKIKAQQSSAAWEIKAFDQALQYNQDEIRSQWQSALSELRNAERQVSLLEKQMEVNERIKNLGISAYENGSATYEEILDIDARSIALKTQRWNAVIDAWQALTQVNFVIGSDAGE
ncbi:MAG: TolC family protein [Cyclobacteriaceae bacterium]|nr:TolC family protein [Cyclobacteriaceae bacterium]